MQKSERNPFIWSDAWLLFSIALTDTGDGSTLKNILAAGDYINHSILSGAEIRHGLELFTQAGYVVEMGGGYAISGEAKVFWEEFQKTHKSLYQALDGFINFLEIGLVSMEEEKNNDYFNPTQYPKLTYEMVLQAYIEYSGVHGKKLKKLLKAHNLTKPK